MASEGRELVLLAEDDPAQREILQEVLEFEGFRVLMAAGPEEVVAQLAHQPDVVLLDLGGVTSPEVMRALGTAPSRPAVLLVSADSRLPAVAQELGVEGFIAKPCDIDALLGEIASALARKRSSRMQGACRAGAP